MSRYLNIQVSRRWLNDLWRDHPALVKEEVRLYRSSLRFGQRFINDMRQPIVLPELFYCQSDNEAYKLIEQNFYIVEDQ